MFISESQKDNDVCLTDDCSLSNYSDVVRLYYIFLVGFYIVASRLPPSSSLDFQDLLCISVGEQM